jgi:hypothetical protein
MAVTPLVYADTSYIRMMVLMEEAAMHPYLLEELAGARVQELHREAARRRLHHYRDLGVDPERHLLHMTWPRRPSIARRAAVSSLHAVGFWLVGAGLRLAVAGTDRRVGR